MDNVTTNEVKGKRGKAKLPCNKDFLTDSIGVVEANGALKNLGALWVAASEHYNSTYPNEPKITPSVALLRTAEYGIAHKTQAGKKGRAAGTPGAGRPKQFVKLPIAFFEAEMKAIFAACEGNLVAQEHCLNLLGALNDEVEAETLEPIEDEEEIPRIPYVVVKEEEVIEEGVPA